MNWMWCVQSGNEAKNMSSLKTIMIFSESKQFFLYTNSELRNILFNIIW
jgi:hypothetical protein